MPGVGRKSAQRIAFHLLERNRDGAREMAASLVAAAENIRHCEQCRMFSEERLCPICSSSSRDATLVCVVETPADVMAVEQAASFNGHYFALMGHLSPLDGIGPVELGLDLLDKKLAGGDIREVILATNPTVEGDATAHYVAEMAAAHGVKASRIAHGVPMGGELEYVDSSTISHAISGRQLMR